MIDENIKFDHLGFVVKSLQNGRNHLAKTYGIENWTDEFFDELNGVSVQFGESHNNICYELVAPIDENSPVHNILLKKTNILNHVAYLVEKIDESASFLINNNFIALGEAKDAIAYGGKQIQFFYSKEFCYMLELVEASDHKHIYKKIIN